MNCNNCYYNGNECYDLRGPTGAQGATGPSGTVGIGTVTTGETTSVTNVGTSTNAIFDFVLPLEKAIYASLQNEKASSLTEVGTIPLTLIEGNGASLNNNNVLSLEKAGTYEITYMVSAEAPVNSVVGLLINDVNAENTNTKLEDNKNLVTYKTIRTIPANTTIALGLITITGTLTLKADGVNAYLTINKL